MNAIKSMLKRRSVRKFKADRIPKSKLDQILDAARWAPSGMNAQPWSFIVIDDPERKKDLRASYDIIRETWGVYTQDSSFLEKATLVLACMDMGKLTPVISVSLAVENMLIAAESLGIGSVVMTTHMISEETKDAVSDLFNLPENIQPHSLIALGYGAEKPKAKKRKPNKETFHHNEFGIEYRLG